MEGVCSGELIRVVSSFMANKTETEHKLAKAASSRMPENIGSTSIRCSYMEMHKTYLQQKNL